MNNIFENVLRAGGEEQDAAFAAPPGAIPSYLLAADNHNIGNNSGGSWFDPSTWGQKFQNAGRMISAGVLSGANSFYNTGVFVGNLLGAKAEENDTAAWIASIDEDLGQYYAQNRESADLLGFVAGSLVPGLGGIKILNAGQKVLQTASKTGLLGENLGRAMGLLVPKTELYISRAASDIASAGATFSAINANGVRALASGAYQGVLEGIAWETAVYATMFRSPILQDQDIEDVIKNIAMGGAVGGVIGGAVNGAVSLGKIKSIVASEEKALKPFSSRELLQEGLTPSDKIILMANDFDGGAVPLPGSQNYDAAKRLYDDRQRRILNDIRSEFHKMTPGTDNVLSNMVADLHVGLDSKTVMENMMWARSISRVSDITPIEREIKKLIVDQKPVPPEYQISYVKLIGEDVGRVSDTTPEVLKLADIYSDKNKILSEVKSYKFKKDQNWSPLDLKGQLGHMEAEARYIWASRMTEIKPGSAINQFDFPMLEKALELKTLDIKLVDDAGGVLVDKFPTLEALQNHIISAKQDVAVKLMDLVGSAIPQKQGSAAIAKILNMRQGRVEGTSILNEIDDFFAHQIEQSKYLEAMKEKRLALPVENGDLHFMPSTAKITRNVDADINNGHVIDGIAFIKSKEVTLKNSVNNVVAKATGQLYGQLQDIPIELLETANRYGAGAGIFSSANGNYGTLESAMQGLGSVVKQVQTEFRKVTQDTMESALVGIGRKQEAVIEAATIDQKVTRSAKQWVYEDGLLTGHRGLISTDSFVSDGAGGFKLVDGFDGSENFFIPIVNDEVDKFVTASIQRTGWRTQTYKELRAAQGLEEHKNPLTYRPARPAPSDYPFFAFVKDPRVTTQGHTTMIFANTEQKLKDLINKVPPEYQVITKVDAEDFFRARNEYEYSRTLHENYIDTSLKNRGVMSEFFTITDPQVYVNRVLQNQLRDDDVLARELIRAKNQAAFDWLEDQAKQYSKIEASRFGGSVSRVEKSGKNPYLDYIKTALDISKINEHPLIYGFNKFLDEAVSKAVGSIRDIRLEKNTPEQMEQINTMLEKYGMNTAYRDAATDLLVNHTAPKGELTKFIRGANAVLAKLTLGLDPFNAINNAIGSNILRSTELSMLTRAISEGNTQVAGRLAELAKVPVPGTPSTIISPAKLISSSISRYFKDLTGPQTLIKEYQAKGYIQDLSTQFKNILDDFTLKGTETVGELQSRLRKAVDKAEALSLKGEKYTGNALAEEFNRFLSADVARQITDIAVDAGLLTKAEQFNYVNTFVNRVEGNVIASQRPLIFQGPIGQAVGLFQSYQFNLIQQLFRYIAEGSKKDIGMLLGLQGTFYGLQGLPAFQFLNQHVVGTASGNTAHRDAYDALYGIAGKDVGNFLIYGLPSNLLHANIYSRGDVNPRHVTILPTTLNDVPFVGAYSKFFGSMYETAKKIGAGAPVWESMLQGLEHNGLSRPLAGLAQTLQATGPMGMPYSTTNSGSILFANDLVSWSTMVRLGGARPLDEAIINDGVFRIKGYQEYDREKKKKLAEVVKTSVIAGNIPSEDDVLAFTAAYAEAGGKQKDFNKFMLNQIKAVSNNEATRIIQKLQNPYAYKMQLLMGNGEIGEF